MFIIIFRIDCLRYILADEQPFTLMRTEIKIEKTGRKCVLVLLNKVTLLNTICFVHFIVVLLHALVIVRCCSRLCCEERK